MKELIYFCITFLVVYMIYYFVSIRKAKKDMKKLPVEVRYLILYYNIDIKKIQYRNFLNTIAMVGSFDVAFTATIVCLFEGPIWQLLFGFVFIVPIIIISFMLVGKYYQKHQNDDKKKESNKNDRRSKNRK